MLLFFILLVSPLKPLLPGRASPHQLTAVVTNTTLPQMTWRFKDLMGAQVQSTPGYLVLCVYLCKEGPLERKKPEAVGVLGTQHLAAHVRSPLFHPPPFNLSFTCSDLLCFMACRQVSELTCWPDEKLCPSQSGSPWKVGACLLALHGNYTPST